MSYNKLKKQQLKHLLINRDTEIDELKEQLALLHIENEKLEAIPPKVIEVVKEVEVEVEKKEEEGLMTDEDKKMVEFLENQIKTTVYKKMIDVYEAQLERILNKYE